MLEIPDPNVTGSVIVQVPGMEASTGAPLQRPRHMRPQARPLLPMGGELCWPAQLQGLPAVHRLQHAGMHRDGGRDAPDGYQGDLTERQLHVRPPASRLSPEPEADPTGRTSHAPSHPLHPERHAPHLRYAASDQILRRSRSRGRCQQPLVVGVPVALCAVGV